MNSSNKLYHQDCFSEYKFLRDFHAVEEQPKNIF